MDIHVYLHGDAALEHSIDQLTKRISTMADELQTLTATVATNTTVTDSAITLLTGLKGQLDAAIAAGNPAALQALSDSLGSETQKLAAAVAANTPAAPTP